MKSRLTSTNRDSVFTGWSERIIQRSIRSRVMLFTTDLLCTIRHRRNHPPSLLVIPNVDLHAATVLRKLLSCACLCSFVSIQRFRGRREAVVYSPNLFVTHRPP